MKYLGVLFAAFIAYNIFNAICLFMSWKIVSILILIVAIILIIKNVNRNF